MSIFPKIKKCPCCNYFNLIKVNGITYENKFISLADWVLKKEFKCKKCKQELGLFINMRNNNEKIIWIDYLKCEDFFYKKLNELQLVKNKAKIKSKKFSSTNEEIREIQNKIRLEQGKLRIKLKIQSHGVLIRHVY
jgi:hypothetical protein